MTPAEPADCLLPRATAPHAHADALETGRGVGACAHEQTRHDPMRRIRQVKTAGPPDALLAENAAQVYNTRTRLAKPYVTAALLLLLVGALTRTATGTPGNAIVAENALLLGWGLAAGAISGRAFGIATTSLLVLGGLLGGLSMAPAPETSVAGKWGRLLAVLVTSLAFAMVHGEQLGQAWGPLLVLFVVGLVLTITRVVTRSVTPGLLIHMGYNLMLFGVLYIGTDHFRHLERMSQ